MIDIHTHILPGIDDGARDIYDTLDMAQMAADSGVTAIVATPHCNIPELFDNYLDAEYVKVFRDTQEAIRREKIPVQLLAGMEVFSTYDLPDLLADKKVMTLNGSRYLLTEFAFDEDWEYAQDILERVYKMKVVPLVAHAERYEFVQDNPQIIYEWREKGYLIQVNKNSFQGGFGRHAERTAYELLDHNLISVIASDAHGAERRTTYMKDVYEMLEEDYSERVLRVLFEENPRRICENRPTLRFHPEPFK